MFSTLMGLMIEGTDLQRKMAYIVRNSRTRHVNLETLCREQELRQRHLLLQLRIELSLTAI